MVIGNFKIILVKDLYIWIQISSYFFFSSVSDKSGIPISAIRHVSPGKKKRGSSFYLRIIVHDSTDIPGVCFTWNWIFPKSNV